MSAHECSIDFLKQVIKYKAWLACYCFFATCQSFLIEHTFISTYLNIFLCYINPTAVKKVNTV